MLQPRLPCTFTHVPPLTPRAPWYRWNAHSCAFSFTLWALIFMLTAWQRLIGPKMETLRKDLDTAENDIKRMQEARQGAGSHL